MSVPDGVSCGDIVPCTINTPEAFYEKSIDVLSDPFSPIDIDIINWLYPDPDLRSGAYASLTIEGTDSNGNAPSSKVFPLDAVILISGSNEL